MPFHNYGAASVSKLQQEGIKSINLTPPSGTTVTLYFIQARANELTIWNPSLSCPVSLFIPICSVKSHEHSQSLPVVLGVKTDRFYSCHDNHHAEGHGNKQHDDMLGSVFQGQLLILVVLGFDHAWRPRCGWLPVLLGSAAAITSSS